MTKFHQNQAKANALVAKTVFPAVHWHCFVDWH